MANEKKFQKMHMIKLDYVETDMTTKKGEIHVRIPSDKQKFPLHREFTAQTRDSANRSAVRETMANDLMSALGVHSQKLKLLPTEYADGHPKLLLDGTFATGPQGGQFSDFDGHLEDGFIVKLKANGKPETDARGHYILDTSINQLGRNKIHMLAMADRDALGSSGGNKGFADNTFIGIDPGHALEENLLGRTGDVHSDFSFDQPSKIEKRGYKNFTIFDQQPLSEKMEGVRKMKELRDSGADVAIFDDYADKFDGTHNPQLNFAGEINGMKAGWIQRRDDILGVFAERLAVDDFQFQKGASPDRQKELANKTLDILDNLEKLTSKTSDLSPKGKVQLERPRVTERREWHVGQSDLGVITMSFTGNSKQAGKVNADLMKFINETPALKEAMDQGMFTVKREGGKVSFEDPARERRRPLPGDRGSTLHQPGRDAAQARLTPSRRSAGPGLVAGPGSQASTGSSYSSGARTTGCGPSPGRVSGRARMMVSSSSVCEHRPRSTGSRGRISWLFQWVRSRTACTVALVVPSSLQICWSLTSGWLRSSQAIASGRSWRLLSGV